MLLLAAIDNVIDEANKRKINETLFERVGFLFLDDKYLNEIWFPVKKII